VNIKLWIDSKFYCALVYQHNAQYRNHSFCTQWIPDGKHVNNVLQYEVLSTVLSLWWLVTVGDLIKNADWVNGKLPDQSKFR